jgi:hypothetical protein
MERKISTAMCCFAIGLLVLILACGCLATKPSGLSENPSLQPDPDTGLIAWMEAINTHDVTGLYNLAPEEIRDQVSLDQFEKANMNNSLMTQDKAVTGYKILNETGNATMTNIRVELLLRQNVSADSLQTETIPLYLNFEEWYEKGEWKVWTLPWS